MEKNILVLKHRTEKNVLPYHWYKFRLYKGFFNVWIFFSLLKEIRFSDLEVKIAICTI